MAHSSSDSSLHTASHDSSMKSYIISAAIDLFREQGYAGTSMQEIAGRVNLNPSSLYHYVSSKEEILESIYARSNSFPALHDTLAPHSDYAAQLYSLISYDVVRKCELPIDFIELESLAHRSPERFRTFFDHYQHFYHMLVKVIDNGSAKGEFISCQADERAVVILSVNEGLQHHYHAKLHNELLLEKSGYTVRNHSPEDISFLSAQVIIPSLLATPRDLNDVAKSAYAHYLNQFD